MEEIKAQAMLQYLMTVNGVSTKQLAKLLRVSERTVYNRLKDTSTITLGELRIMVKALKMSDAQLFEILGGKE